jgi:hypothetical protein
LKGRKGCGGYWEVEGDGKEYKTGEQHAAMGEQRVEGAGLSTL